MSIEHQLLVFGLNGICWGMAIALVAIGLSLVFGLMEIINIAHGELYMMGAVLAWYMVQHGGNFWVGLLIVPLIVGLIGVLIHLLVIRPVEVRPIQTLIATFGLSLILQQVALVVLGGEQYSIRDPLGTVVTLGEFRYPGYRLFLAVISGIVLLGLMAIIYRTKFGLWIRAARQDREMAATLGIPVRKVYLGVFALGAGLAAVGGVLAAPITGLEFNMGVGILPSSFIVVIIGGFGNLLGTFVAAILVGFLEGIANVFMTPTAAKTLLLLFMAVVLLIRPQGLLGERG